MNDIKKISDYSIVNTTNFKDTTTEFSAWFDDSDIIFDNFINNTTNEPFNDKLDIHGKKIDLLDLFDYLINNTTNEKITTENIVFEPFKDEFDTVDNKITTENKDVIYDKTIIKNFFDCLFNYSNKPIEKTAINIINNSFEYICNITQLIIKSEFLRNKILEFIKFKIDIINLEKYKNKDISKIKLLFQTKYKNFNIEFVKYDKNIKYASAGFFKLYIDYDIRIFYDEITNKILYFSHHDVNKVVLLINYSYIDIDKEYLLKLFLYID